MRIAYAEGMSEPGRMAGDPPVMPRRGQARSMRPIQVLELRIHRTYIRGRGDEDAVGSQG